jgi:hypothetical protein
MRRNKPVFLSCKPSTDSIFFDFKSMRHAPVPLKCFKHLSEIEVRFITNFGREGEELWTQTPRDVRGIGINIPGVYDDLLFCW